MTPLCFVFKTDWYLHRSNKLAMSQPTISIFRLTGVFSLRRLIYHFRAHFNPWHDYWYLEDHITQLQAVSTCLLRFPIKCRNLPKLWAKPITGDVNSLMIQSEFLRNTYNWRQERERIRGQIAIGFGLTGILHRVRQRSTLVFGLVELAIPGNGHSSLWQSIPISNTSYCREQSCIYRC